MQCQDCRGISAQQKAEKRLKKKNHMKPAHFKRRTLQRRAHAVKRKFGRLTLEVVSAADFPGPTRLHLEPKAERELA